MADVVFEVEYEIAPIRHAYVTCPKCNNKFMAHEVTDSCIHSERDIRNCHMVCPLCKSHYNLAPGGWDRAVIKEVDYPKCAEGAKYKREVWTENDDEND